MAFKKGQVANPKGRPRGAKNKRTVATEVLTRLAVKGKKTPLEFMLALVANEKADLFLRMEAAKAALPYCHKKMPTDVNVENPSGNGIAGGVMLVPATEELKTWAQRAAAAQAQLKKEVIH
jgi:hypothetical protein